MKNNYDKVEWDWIVYKDEKATFEFLYEIKNTSDFYLRWHKKNDTNTFVLCLERLQLLSKFLFCNQCKTNSIKRIKWSFRSI